MLILGNEGMPTNNLRQNEKRYLLPKLLEVSSPELAARDLMEGVY